MGSTHSPQWSPVAQTHCLKYYSFTKNFGLCSSFKQNKPLMNSVLTECKSCTCCQSDCVQLRILQLVKYVVIITGVNVAELMKGTKSFLRFTSKQNVVSILYWLHYKVKTGIMLKTISQCAEQGKFRTYLNLCRTTRCMVRNSTNWKFNFIQLHALAFKQPIRMP